MKNQQIANMFSQMADLMEILGEDPFRVGSYRKVAHVLAEMSQDIEKIASAGSLQEVPGIGKSTAQKIQEYLESGRIARHDELLAKAPPGLADLLNIQGMGPKTILHLWKDAGITSQEQLREVLDKDPDRLQHVARMGQKKIQQLKEALEFGEDTGGRILLGQADKIAQDLLAHVSKAPGVARLSVAGSLRRGRDTIGDIDIVCTASTQHAQPIIETFTHAPRVARVLAAGKTKGSVQLDMNVQADLRVVEDASYGAAMAYFTGSKSHNVHLRDIALKKGLKLNEYGLFRDTVRIAGSTEKEIYEALGLSYVEPEMREDQGELDLAAQGELPPLVTLADIQGDMHLHSTFSDGRLSVEELAAACKRRRYKYLAITDHSKSQPQAGGMSEDALARYANSLRAEAARHKDITILVGCEVDILSDGSLDYGPDTLKQLDYVLASPHKSLQQAGQEATARIIKAIESGLVHCIGHATGRIINSRRGLEIDIEKIAQAAATNNVAMEINANYYRLDLRDSHARACIAKDVKIIVSTDAHVEAELDMMKYGVLTARRAWASCADVVNTWPIARVTQWLKR